MPDQWLLLGNDKRTAHALAESRQMAAASQAERQTRDDDDAGEIAAWPRPSVAVHANSEVRS